MRTKYFVQFLIVAALASFGLQLSTVFAQGTAFTYQGQLNDNGSPADGTYDLRFAIFDAASGGTQQGATLTNAGTVKGVPGTSV